MKNSALIILLALGVFVFTPDVSGQIKINLKEKINREASKRVNKKADENVKKGFDKFESGLKGILGNEAADSSTANQPSQNNNQNVITNQAQGNKQAQQAAQSSPTLSWSKYDFVPGDKIIFEDNLLHEENGEFPSRWDLFQGTIENAEFGGEKVIMFRGGSPMIVPYLKNPNIDYLPEVFTIEFDLYMNNHNNFQVYFFDRKNQNVSSNYSSLGINYQGMELSPARSRIPENGSIDNQWAHISIAFTNGKMKAYINETRLINIPHLHFDPMGITLHAYHGSDINQFFIKNFRLAEGGVKYYDRFLQDGKIVSNGIRFDVGKASLRPESMGVLNEIYKMLSEHPDVAVSIEGHTDSDGDNDLNQKLSEDRAETVMKQLVSMGLSKDRLSFRGYGESKPVAPNDTPEGKASNRRVEFVKKSGAGSQNSSTSINAPTNGNHKAAANINAQEAQESDPLYSATIRADVEAAKKALADGADINRQSDNGYTALMWASTYSSRSPYDEMAKFLINAGADVNIRANDGTTALLDAAERSKEITLMLLEKGADITVRRDDGRGIFTSCIFGILMGATDLELAELMLSKGADVNEAATSGDVEGWAAIHYACSNGNKDLVSFLIKKGADVNAKTADGKTPISLVGSKHPEIVEMLKAAGAK